MGILIVISTGLAPEDLVVQDVHCCCCPKMSLKSPVSLLEEDVQLLVLKLVGRVLCLAHGTEATRGGAGQCRST